MPMMTGAQYKESLMDGRLTYIDGDQLIASRMHALDHCPLANVKAKARAVAKVDEKSTAPAARAASPRQPSHREPPTL
jgi:hypothetical protein